MKAYIGTLEEIKENVLANPSLIDVGEIKQLSELVDFVIYYSASENVNFQNKKLREELNKEIVESL
ncbi:hypothetical protein LJB88_03145 [Erysipelotrichaceae bacterium OttesenSCG-928-M19]|nr:hypothetical protein [Erysipelotrichaceae bacterium OttesenSCG-928-M19]